MHRGFGTGAFKLLRVCVRRCLGLDIFGQKEAAILPGAGRLGPAGNAVSLLMWWPWIKVAAPPMRKVERGMSAPGSEPFRCWPPFDVGSLRFLLPGMPAPSVVLQREGRCAGLVKVSERGRAVGRKSKYFAVERKAATIKSLWTNTRSKFNVMGECEIKRDGHA